MPSRTNKLLAAGLGVLAVAVAVQGVLLYRLTQQNNPSREVRPRVDIAPETWNPFQGSPLASEPWDPFAEVKSAQQRLGALLNSARAGGLAQPDFAALTLEDTGAQYVAEMPLPPGGAKEIDVRIEDGSLIVSGKTSRAPSPGGRSGAQSVSARFEHRVTLPAPVQPSTLQTDITDGLLIITLDKKP